MSFHLAIGIIETRGMAAAIEAGDAAVKAANVRLMGYELSKGGGWVTVKITGDVGAVKAAVAAGSAAAEKVNKVIGTLVLPRPHVDIKGVFHSPDNVCPKEDTVNPVDHYIHPVSERSDVTPTMLPEDGFDSVTVEQEKHLDPSTYECSIVPAEPPDEDKSAELAFSDEIGDEEYFDERKKPNDLVCNICHDENCPRVKGEPRNLCIHFKSSEQED